MSMLLEAVHRVNVQRAAALLARGADVNTTDAQGVTPLIIACERGKISQTLLIGTQHPSANSRATAEFSPPLGIDVAV